MYHMRVTFLQGNVGASSSLCDDEWKHPTLSLAPGRYPAHAVFLSLSAEILKHCPKIPWGFSHQKVGSMSPSLASGLCDYLTSNLWRK